MNHTVPGRILRLVIENSLLLVGGALAALVWANVHEATYQHAAQVLHFVVNDIAMVFFFGLAAKEVFDRARILERVTRLERPRRSSILSRVCGGEARPGSPQGSS
jgi:NhaA family Na+:H+ antiporter